MNDVVFTSKLPIDLLNWIDYFAKSQKIAKKKVLENALLDYQKKLKQQEMAKSFQQAKKDLEIQKISEENLDDYKTIIAKN